MCAARKVAGLLRRVGGPGPQEQQLRSRPTTQGGTAAPAGRKSAAAQAAAAAAAQAERRRARKGAKADAPGAEPGGGKRSKFGKSAVVFGQLQDRAEATAAGAALPAKARQQGAVASSKALKL
jgi:hypothetical protein